MIEESVEMLTIVIVVSISVVACVLQSMTNFATLVKQLFSLSPLRCCLMAVVR